MVAAPSLHSFDLRSLEPEKRIIIDGVPWKTYVLLRDAIDEPRLKMTYCEGVLELMSTSDEHELNKTLAARLLEHYSLLVGIPLVGYGSTTYKSEARRRGAEPDESYLVGERAVDRAFPDIVLEVIETSPLLDKLHVYDGFEVPEVWLFQDGKFIIHRRKTKGGYAKVARSAFFPALDFKAFARFAVRGDQDAAIREFAATLKPKKRSRRRR